MYLKTAIIPTMLKKIEFLTQTLARGYLKAKYLKRPLSILIPKNKDFGRESITQQIHTRLRNRAKTISVAESCTGGLLSSLLTSLPGSSDYFILGVVTYSNKSKEMILSIPAKIITKYGAVSRQVAILMAQNIRKKTSADFGLSITGIAGPARSGVPRRGTSNGVGPTGATPAKSIGTVYICLSGNNKNICRKFHFPGNRKNIRNKSTQEALRLLCAHLSP